MIALALATSLALQPFSAGGIRQGMTRADVSQMAGRPVDARTAEADVVSDGRTYTVLFCGDRVHGLRAPYANGAEWLSAIEWLQSQGFRLGPSRITAREDGREERRELRQPLSHANAGYRVQARMISRSSSDGATVSYQLDFASTAACRLR